MYELILWAHLAPQHAPYTPHKIVTCNRKPSCLTCVIILAAWLLKAGSQNFFVLRAFWWISVCFSYLHFECFPVEEQTAAKQSKNNHSKLQNKDTVHRIISFSDYAALKSLPSSVFFPDSSSSSSSQVKEKSGAGEPWSFVCETHGGKKAEW